MRNTLLGSLALVALGCGSTAINVPGDGGPVIIVDAPPPVDVTPFDVGTDVLVDFDVPPPDIGPPDTSPLDVPLPPIDGQLMDGRVPRCGDGVIDPGEVCDDGNNRSGDGCRADCLSNETCGNGIIDTEVGEVCDGTPGCGPDCRTITTCGNGHVDPGEQCDDGNTARWDGCGPDCRTEQALVYTQIGFAPDDGHTGCDYIGRGMVTNALGHALGPGAGILSSYVNSGISNGGTLIQLGFMNLTDPLGRSSPDVSVAWLLGSDANSTPLDNLLAGNPQYVQRGSLRPGTDLPAAAFVGNIAMGELAGGPEEVLLDLPAGLAGRFTFHMVRGRIGGTLVADTTHITNLTHGVLCGVIPAHDLANLDNPAGAIMGGGMRMGTSTFLDLIVGGQSLFILTIGPQQPDIDLDGDGLEHYDATMGSLFRPPEITACHDGDGTVIMGHDCIHDPRMADGFSSAFQTAAIWITLRGVRPLATTGGDAGVPTGDAGVGGHTDGSTGGG